MIGSTTPRPEARLRWGSLASDGTRRSPSFTYAVTFAAMAITVYFRWQFQGVLGERGLYSTFLPSVIIAAHFGGLWPGLVATIASVLITNSLLVGHLLHLDAKTAADTLAMLVFAGTGGVISLLSESLHRVQGRRIQMEQERRAQLTIQRTEERFTHLMLHSSDIIGVFSPDGTILYQTPSVMRILGYPASQRVGQNVLSDPIVHPDDRESQRGFLASILDQPGTPIRSELRLRHANGAWRDFEAIGQVLMDDPGAVVLIANYRDITDRKAAENAIQDSEQRWRSLVQTLPQLIWTTNPRGMGTYFSPQFLEFCGQSTEALLNSGWHGVVHRDDLAGVIERWKKAVDTGEPYLHEHRIRRADGAYHWFRVHAIPVRDPAGRIVRWLGSCTDVTDLKQSARELLLARDAAESANRAKDEFLANVSHEIRTPLNAILGMTDLVLDSTLECQQRNLLTTVKAAGANLMEIVNDLLDFSKLAAGKLVLHSAPFPLRTVVQESIQLLATRAAEQGIELRCDIGSDVPEHVVGDAVRLRQILLNLLMNGIKFTPQGSVSLSVERRPASQADCAVVEFRVRDTGIGISPEKQALIFKAFEQEDSTTTRRFGGTGLGLTISSRLVQALGGGEIQLTSAPGQGSTFSFAIAFEIAAASQVAATRDTAESPSSAAGESSSTEKRPPLRILVAEDNPFNGQLMTSLLGKRGHAVVIAENGEVALKAATSQAFDLMLLDIHMPVLDGFEVIDGLRTWEASQPGRRRLPVIALTARSSREIRDRCLEAGMNDVLQKPTPADDLFRAIDAVVGGRQETSASADSLIDRQMMLAVCGANENVMEGLKTAVLENLPKQLGDLERLDASGSLVELRESAHKIAGTLRAFSKPCGDLALAIEESAIAGDGAACHRGVGQLAQEVGRLLKEIEGLTFNDLMRVAEPIVA